MVLWKLFSWLLIIIKELKIKKRRQSVIIQPKEIPQEYIKIYDFQRDSLQVPKFKNTNNEFNFQVNKLNNNDNILQSNNKLNNELSINKSPKKKKRKLKTKMKIVNNIFGVNDLSNNNIDYINSNNINSIEDRKEQIIQTEKDNLPKLKKTKAKKQGNEKRNYITHIKLNKCCIYLFFYVLKEGKIFKIF